MIKEYAILKKKPIKQKRTEHFAKQGIGEMI